MARPGWKSVTFLQECFIEHLPRATAHARCQWDAASCPCSRTASLHVKASKPFASTWTHFSFFQKPSWGRKPENSGTCPGRESLALLGLGPHGAPFPPESHQG